MLQAEARRYVSAEWPRWVRGYGTTTFNVDILLFRCWLSEHRPDWLAFKCQGDKWAVVKGWIQLYEDQQSRCR